MAQIIVGKSRCPVCREPILAEDEIFATSGAFLSEDHPLWMYCDAGIHWDCFVDWDRRPEFARALVEHVASGEPHDPHYGSVYRGRSLYVQLSRGTVRIWFYSTGRSHSVGLTDWENWVPNPTLHPLERTDWDAEGLSLTTADLLAKVDWDAKRSLQEEQSAEELRLWEKRQDDRAAYNQRMDQLREEKCPRCAHPTLRYLDRRPEGKSFFICRGCGRSAHLANFPTGLEPS